MKNSTTTTLKELTIDGFKGWSKYSYLLYAIGIITQVIILFSTKNVTHMTYIMFIASILGITTVLQISNLKRANALNGMISSSLIIYSAIVNHVFADGLLQLVYIVALDIPLLFIWGKSKEETATTQIENLQGWLKYIGLMLGLFIGFYLVLSIPAIADKQPIIDSLGVAIGLTASMLLLQKNKHQYVFWALQGIISIILWARASMISGGSLFSPLAVMYVFYLLNDLVGYTVYSKKGKKAIHV